MATHELLLHGQQLALHGLHPGRHRGQRCYHCTSCGTRRGWRTDSMHAVFTRRRLIGCMVPLMEPPPPRPHLDRKSYKAQRSMHSAGACWERPSGCGVGVAVDFQPLRRPRLVRSPPPSQDAPRAGRLHNARTHRAYNASWGHVSACVRGFSGGGGGGAGGRTGGGLSAGARPNGRGEIDVTYFQAWCRAGRAPVGPSSLQLYRRQACL